MDSIIRTIFIEVSKQDFAVISVHLGVCYANNNTYDLLITQL
jgi:hypothetical protein